jgi:hypothetical protein
VGDGYRFDERSYDALARAGIAWQTVLHVLRTSPRLRHHLGRVLRIAAQARDGRWIGVTLIEEADDEYLVVSARELGPAEVAAVTGKLEGNL